MDSGFHRKIGPRIGALLIVAVCGCTRVPPVKTEFASPTPVPPVRHASPRPQPTPDRKTEEKLAIQPASVQAQRWERATVKPSWKISIDKAVMLYLRTKDRYEAVERMRSNGVPAPVIFTLHYRESSNSFTSHLHEGSSLLHRTRYVPRGRLLTPDPPYKWEVSAEDAIYVADKLQGDWDDLKWSLDRIESYNGPGYRKRAIPSPYLWSGTTVYESGKFVSDGHFSASAIDQQAGCVAILKRMQERGINLEFAP